MQRHSRRDFRRLRHVRHDLLARDARAAVESGERDARTEELEEVAARQVVGVMIHDAAPTGDRWCSS